MKRSEQRFLELCEGWGRLQPGQAKKIIRTIRHERANTAFRKHSGGIFLAAMFLIWFAVVVLARL